MSFGYGFALPRTRPLPGGGFVPDAAFFAGRPGLAWDFTDKTLLFQSNAGTGAVTADNDPIRYVTDLSGNGKHGTTTGTMAPLYKAADPRALFDGVDDILVSPTIDLTGTDKVTVVVAWTLLSDALSVPFEFSQDAGSTNGAFNAFRSFSSAGDITPLAFGTSQGYRQKNGISAPVSGVFTFQYDIAPGGISDEIGLRIGGVAATFDTGSGMLGTGNFGTFPFYLGSRLASLPANIAVKRIVVGGWKMTADELAKLGG